MTNDLFYCILKSVGGYHIYIHLITHYLERQPHPLLQLKFILISVSAIVYGLILHSYCKDKPFMSCVIFMKSKFKCQSR